MLQAHVVRVLFVAAELVWPNYTVVCTEEEQRRGARPAVAVPTRNVRQIAEKASVVLDACPGALWLSELLRDC